MKTGVGLFISSGLFGFAIAIAYWFSSHHYGGAIFLGLIGVGLSVATIYAIAAEREANLSGDDPNISQATAAGENLGIFTTASAWPILTAIAALLVLLGAVWSYFVLFCGVVLMLICLWRMGAESARVGHEELTDT